MKVSDQGGAFIAKHEGYVASWYLDPVGVPTIGHGFTWRSSSFRKWWGVNRPGVRFQRGVSMTRAEAAHALRMLLDDEYGPPVEAAFGPVAQHVFDGCTSVAFNVGARVLKWKWAQALRRGDLRSAAKLLRTTATTAKGRKLRGLVIRRAQEADLIEHGTYAVGHSRPVKTERLLRRGSRGPRVEELIAGLTRLGFYDGVQDDIFGRGTEAAVLAFQRSEGLKADGIAGPVTMARMSARLEGSKEPQPTPLRSGLFARFLQALLSAIGSIR